MRSWRLIAIGVAGLLAACFLSGCATLPQFPSDPGAAGLSWLDRAVQVVSEKWPEWKAKYEDQFNVPGLPALVPATTQVSVAWKNGAAYRMMNDSADGVDLATFQRRVNEAKAAGCNTYLLFLHNIKDGQPVPTTIYESGGMGGKVSEARLKLLRDKALYVLAQGMQLDWFVLADDGGIAYKDVTAIKSFLADVKTHMGDIIEQSHYVVWCIEADEVYGAGGREYVETYCAELQRLFTGPSIGNHMTSGEYDWSMECPSVDVHFHQVNPSKSAAECEAELRAVVAKATKPVMACEFSLHGDTAEASEKATRALAAGCIGVLSGVPK